MSKTNERGETKRWVRIVCLVVAIALVLSTATVVLELLVH